VGLDGLGNGTFLWDRSRGISSFQAQLEIRTGLNIRDLPSGFSLKFNADDLTAPIDVLGPNVRQVIDQAREQILNQARNSLNNCIEAGRQAAGGSQAGLNNLITALGKGLTGKATAEAVKYASRKLVIEKGFVAKSLLARLFRWFVTQPIVTPLAVVSLFLAMSYANAPTPEQLESERAYVEVMRAVREACTEANKKKYGA
jgi:hypothetical protein